jgi:hypothetical protein
MNTHTHTYIYIYCVCLWVVLSVHMFMGIMLDSKGLYTIYPTIPIDSGADPLQRHVALPPHPRNLEHEVGVTERSTHTAWQQGTSLHSIGQS